MRVRGYFDVATRRRVTGWARDLDNPDCPVSLVVTVNGAFAGRVLADSFRGDLKKIDGVGRFAFDFRFAEPLPPLGRFDIDIRGELDGTRLKKSPRTVEPAAVFDADMRHAMANVFASFDTDAEAEARLAFLAEQTEAILKAGANLRSELAREARRRMRWRTGQGDDQTPPARPRALVIDDRVPEMERDAGSVAIVSHMQSLARHGYDVSLVAAKPGRTATAACLKDFTVFSSVWYGSVEEVLARHARSFDVVYLHRSNTAFVYAPLVRHYQPSAQVIYAVADLASLRLRRQAEREQRPELAALVRRHAEQELRACQQADAVITHSSVEAALLRRSLRHDKVRVVPFAVSSQPTRTPFASRTGLAFIGGYEHAPNVDAALWLAERIMPEVTRLNPAIRCSLAGSAMPDHVRALANETILPIGAVPDLSTLFGSVRLTVAPLTFGAGIKGKVLESLAAGIPCVCTPIAAEGLGLPEPLSLLVANEPASLAALMVRLHEDEAFNALCAEAGLAYIAERNSHDAVDRALEGVLRAGRVSSLPPAARGAA